MTPGDPVVPARPDGALAPGPAPAARRKGPSTGQVLVVTSVMFTFISYWRTAAIVLCDLACTAYYIGGIVESQIGKAAPWFILGVMVFSYAVRAVYIESCSMFVRGGVYRIVKEAMGGTTARLAVSALMFDYILTGPISGVSAGQYVIGLVNELLLRAHTGVQIWKNFGSMVIAVLITLYFRRANIKGMHESSDKALKIMGATTVMAVVILIWCFVTVAVTPRTRHLPTMLPDLSKKVDPETHKPVINEVTGKQEDPLGWIGETSIGERLRPGRVNWLSLVGVLGLFVAFGHSILAMSGEETLAQVYREVESPKLPNFKKAAFIVFVYSLLLTSLISFFAVMIIPDGERLTQYKDNLIGGLAMNVVGPVWARLILNALVVVVGSLILSGAVNTAIVGSNGVLNRVAEDGVIPDWFQRPHPRYGTTYRLLDLIVGLQLFTIFVSGGDVLILGEAYAFGVVWSFVFNALSMLVLRFTRPGHREFEVPLNIRVGKYDVPVGLAIIFLTLSTTAVVNLWTKQVATISGAIFTLGFFFAFVGSEWARRRHAKAAGTGAHEHLEQFNQGHAERVTPASLGITKPFRKLVAIRSPHNLSMLEKCLSETDPETTDVVVMTANVIPKASADLMPAITDQDRTLLTAVVNMAENVGKPVMPLIVPTNEPLYALTRTAHELGAQELIMGLSNKYAPDDQLDQIALYWLNVCQSKAEPLTIRVLGQGRDVRLDIAGGSQIPRGIGRAESVKTLADLRASWRGVERLLLAYDGSALSGDFLDTVLSFLDPAIAVTLIDVAESGTTDEAVEVIQRGVERARELGRAVESVIAQGQPGAAIVRAAQEGKFDAIFLSLRGEYRRGDTSMVAPNTRYVLEHAPCRVILGYPPKTIQQAAGAVGSETVAAP